MNDFFTALQINQCIYFCKINQLQKEMSDGKSLSKKVNESPIFGKGKFGAKSY